MDQQPEQLRSGYWAKAELPDLNLNRILDEVER
jgi:hypothetical protein